MLLFSPHLWLLPMCHPSSKFVYHLSSGKIFWGFGFCIFLHDALTTRFCCEDFFLLFNLKGSNVWCHHTPNEEMITLTAQQIKQKSKSNLAMFTTHLFCIVVYAFKPFRLTSSSSSLFFRLGWIIREVQNNGVVRCCKAWWWWWWCWESWDTSVHNVIWWKRKHI